MNRPCTCDYCALQDRHAAVLKELAEAKRMNVLMASVIKRNSLSLDYAETVQIEVLETKLPIG